MAPVQTVHLLGHSGFILGAWKDDWCCIFLKTAKHFGDVQTSVESPVTKSKDSLQKYSLANEDLRNVLSSECSVPLVLP